MVYYSYHNYNEENHFEHHELSEGEQLKMTFGKQLKELRTGKQLTQECLAGRLNVDRTTIAKWESDQSSPSILDAKRISEVLGVSLRELLEDTEKKQAMSSNNAVKTQEPVREYITFFLLCVLSIVSFDWGHYFCTAGVLYSFKNRFPIWLKVMGILLWYHIIERVLFALHLIDIPSIIIIK